MLQFRKLLKAKPISFQWEQQIYSESSANKSIFAFRSLGNGSHLQIWRLLPGKNRSLCEKPCRLEIHYFISTQYTHYTPKKIPYCFVKAAAATTAQSVKKGLEKHTGSCIHSLSQCSHKSPAVCVVKTHNCEQLFMFYFKM